MSATGFLRPHRPNAQEGVAIARVEGDFFANPRRKRHYRFHVLELDLSQYKVRILAPELVDMPKLAGKDNLMPGFLDQWLSAQVPEHLIGLIDRDLILELRTHQAVAPALNGEIRP